MTSMEDIVSLCKRRGFVFQGSEIYGGLAGTWDYGPLGLALKKNIMNLWWKMFVEDRDDMYGVDAAILMNQKVWQASGHVDTFTDPMVDCGSCGNRFRSDQLIAEHKADYEKIIASAEKEHNADAEKLIKEIESNTAFINKLDAAVQSDLNEFLNTGKLKEYVLEQLAKMPKYQNAANAAINSRKNIELARQYQGITAEFFLKAFVKCPVCGHKDKWGTAREFNMMFKTNVGPVDDESSVSYLRPETAQGIFTNFKNVVDTFYPDVPFGIAQQGKAFRNEISPRDFVFRSREFEQMEIEYFVQEKNWEKEFDGWIKNVYAFLDAVGIPKAKVHEVEVPKADRAHYSKRTIDFEFDFPHKRDELLGLAYRTTFDLDNIAKHSGKSMEYRPKDGSEAFVPHVIEPSFGVERAIMAVLVSAYAEDEQNGEKRTYLKLPAHIAPVKVAVSPLLKNKPELAAKAREVYDMLKKEFGAVMYDDNGNIGKRYRRQDEIGTPYCVVIDFDTLKDNSVTVRDRDTTAQKRVKIKNLVVAVKA